MASAQDPARDGSSQLDPPPKTVPTEQNAGKVGPSKLSRSLGAILGVHAGDSLGATCEFMVRDDGIVT
jgi:hypothetical protein